MAKLLAIDGLYIVRRVYEANTDPESAGKAETALRHAHMSFRKLLLTHLPTHVLAAFDHGGQTWRHQIYPAYRLHHAPLPEELTEGLPDFFHKLEDFGLHPVCIPDVEAEDVIATTVSHWLDERRGEAVIAATDKDLHGLIARGALMWDHFKSEWHDRDWVEQRFGVAPEMLGDLLALVGDASNNIPGVSKIGTKTAAKLLRAYGDLDALMAGAGILPDALGARLRKERDALEISRKLVHLKTDVRVGVTWKTLAFDAQRFYEKWA